MKNTRLRKPLWRQCLVFLALCLALGGAVSAAACAEPVVLDTASAREMWFFSDGGILVAERSFANELPVVRRLHGYDASGQLRWSYSLQNTATGDISCAQAAEGSYAVLYRHDGGYCIEFLSHDGEWQHTTPLPEASRAALIPEGLVYQASAAQGDQITFVDWAGNQRNWLLGGYDAFTFGNIALCADARLYVFAFHREDGQSASSVIALSKGGGVAWEYSLGKNTDCMFSAWTENDLGGLTLQVQRWSDDGKQSSGLLCLASDGGELWRQPLGLATEVFSAQLMRQSEDGVYVMYGLRKDSQAPAGETLARIICDAEAQTMTVDSLTSGYGACVRYRDGLPYVLFYTSDLTSAQLYPAE